MWEQAIIINPTGAELRKLSLARLYLVHKYLQFKVLKWSQIVIPLPLTSYVVPLCIDMRWYTFNTIKHWGMVILTQMQASDWHQLSYCRTGRTKKPLVCSPFPHIFG